jgi:hypothetical protein
MNRSSFLFFIVPAFLCCAVCSFASGRELNYSRRIYETDSLPRVFPENRGDLMSAALRREAAIKSAAQHLSPLKKDWEADQILLRKRILKKTGALTGQKLPLNIRETGNQQMNGYRIRNIAFQTRPGIYATANLYIPDGKGKFPAVIVMMGHSFDGRFYDKYQSVGITLALNGYVALSIDPWGSGERTTYDGVFEDHGDDNNLGTALLDVGETLMGMQITDNIRGVDVLCSLPFVDADRIGATGASGGGNQAIWLTALDKRIRAVVPVVSAGTYESFVMGSPCICEILPDALTFTEEAGVLALIAPRAIDMCNHYRDANAAFNPREMLKSYSQVRPVFNGLGVEKNISYSVFDLPHGYFPEDRLAMLNWFNLHLRKTRLDSITKEIPFHTLPFESLSVYPKGKRDEAVVSTAQYCQKRGAELRSAFMKREAIHLQAKRIELKQILHISRAPALLKTTQYSDAAGWVRFGLETTDHKSIPLLVRIPTKGSGAFVMISDPDGKQHIPSGLIDRLSRSGSGIAIVDLSGTGETASAALHSTDSAGRLRTYSRSCLLLGKTVMGEWVKELQTVAQFVHLKYHPSGISIYGSKEAGLAALFLAATGAVVDEVTLVDAPVSYLFDRRDSIEYFSTGIHVPGFLNWGDVSLAAALSGKKSIFTNPVSMSGRKIEGVELDKYKAEFEAVRKRGEKTGTTIFN